MDKPNKYAPYKNKSFGKIELALEDGTVFLRLWYILRIRRLFSIRLHHILLPDQQLEPHDHPYSFLSIVLRGGYVERWTSRGTAELWRTPANPLYNDEGVLLQPPFDTNFVRRLSFHLGSDLHKITSLFKESAWTLVITGPERREWGFMFNRRGWMPAKDVGAGGLL